MANSAFDHSPSITVPGSSGSTNDAVVRWDGTGGLTFQNSVLIVTDAGAISGATQISIDNIRIYDNSIISTNSNGAISITPNGTGSVAISKADINGGTIDATTIGVSTASTIAGTTITAATSVTTPILLLSGSSNSLTLDVGNSVAAYTVILPDAAPTADDKILKTSGGSPYSQLVWGDAAGGGAISSTSGGAANYITRYSGTATLVGDSKLQFATDDGNYLTIDSGSNTSDGATIYLRIPANSTANPTLRWFEGSANGSTGNMRYQIGYEANGNKFSMYSRAIAGISGSAGTGGNIFEIADGTKHVKFSGPISVGKGADNQAAIIDTTNTQNVGTSATTIYNQGASSPQGVFMVIMGRDSGGANNKFLDLVLNGRASTPQVVSSYTSDGSAPGRTYSNGGETTRLAMASGTFDICVLAFALPNPN